MDIIVDLIHIIFRLIMTILLFRFWMQWAGVNFYNPVAEIVVRFSEPFTKLLRRIMPRSRRYDWSSLAAMLLLAISMLLIIFVLLDMRFIRIESIFTRSIGMVLDVSLNTLFFTLIIRAIASWVAVTGNNPALDLINQLTDPLLTPIRRLMPPTSGIDFSPMILGLLVWITLRVLQKFFLI